jgi:segregation and condensation protein B
MGRKNLPGRPLIYGTTKKFLEVFDLKDIDALPKLKEITSFGAEEYEGTGNGENGEKETPEGRAEESAPGREPVGDPAA